MYNRTVIIGRLNSDPEFKTRNDIEYARFGLVNLHEKDGKTEEVIHRIAAFGKSAVLCKNYLHEGDLCCIEGRLDSRTYKKNGETCYSQTIVAEKITFLSSKRTQRETA